jgi:hypothetical protein
VRRARGVVLVAGGWEERSCGVLSLSAALMAWSGMSVCGLEASIGPQRLSKC